MKPVFVPELRPMSTREILRTAWRLYREDPDSLLATVQWPCAICGIITIVASILGSKSLGDGVEALWLLGLYPATVCVSQAAMAVAVEQLYRSEHPGVATAFRVVRPHWPLLAVMGPLGLGAIMLGLSCLLVPGFYLGMVLMLLVPVIACEGLPFAAAWKRSRELVAPTWGQCAAIWGLLPCWSTCPSRSWSWGARRS